MYQVRFNSFLEPSRSNRADQFMDQLSGLPGKVVCQPIQPPFVQEIEIQLVPKGNRFTQIDCIEQGLLRKGQVEAAPGLETGEKAGGKMGKFDRHPAVLDVPGRTDRRAERQHGADHRGLQQDAVTIQGPFAGDVGGGAQKAGDLLDLRPILQEGVDIHPPGDTPDHSAFQRPRQKDIGVAGEFLHIGVAEELRQLLENFHRCHGRATSALRNSINND